MSEIDTMPDADVAMSALHADDDGASLPPEQPSLPPGEWVRKNLFASATDAALTLVFGAFALWATRALLRFTFSPEREWRSSWSNMRLMMTQSYPIENYARIWVSVGVVAVLTGLSLALYRSNGLISLKRLLMWTMSTGATIAAAVILTPYDHEELAEDGTPLPTRSFGEALSDRWIFLAVGLAILAVGVALWYGFGDQRRRNTFIPWLGLVFGFLGLLVLSLWVIPYGNYAFVSETGEFLAEKGELVAETTRTPWTVMWVLLVASFAVGYVIRNATESWLRPLLGILWLLAPFIIYWGIQRAPLIDWGRIASRDLPMFIGFAVIGSLILWFLSTPGLGEIGRVIGALLVAWGLFQWVIAFFGWIEPGWPQKIRISFLLLGLVALAAPTFAGDRATRLRFVTGWVGIIFVAHFLITLINTPSQLVIQQPTFQGGFNLTLFVASISVLLSFPLGVILALGRTSTMPIFRLLSTAYIELVRGVPLITVLFFASNILPLFLPESMDLSELAAVTAGFTLFSAAYLAENVRGGLQSIRRGQFEAADALGLTTPQRTSFIVLPQALRVSIPPLVGQLIASYKETSLLFIIGAFDLLRIGNNVIPAQTEFLGIKKESLLIICVIYWVGAFSMSKYSQKLERRLGVGER